MLRYVNPVSRSFVVAVVAIATAPVLGQTADWNGDSTVDFDDVLSYLASYDEQASEAELTGDGVLNSDDVYQFLLAHTLATLPPVEPDRPELGLPITDEKLVIAHYMTGMVPTPEAETGWLDPARYDPQGFTSEIGGLYQTMPTISAIAGDVSQLPSLVEAALFEMRAAKALGVDGFNFYYPLGPNEAFRDRYASYIAAFFDAAEANNLDFKLTLCVAPYGHADKDAFEKAEIFGMHLRGLLEETAGSDNWLRTPDGRLLIYTWLADAMVANVWGGNHWEIRNDPGQLQTVATAFEYMGQIAGEEIAIMYHLDQGGEAALVDEALKYFPAMYQWVSIGESSLDQRRDIANLCAQRGRTYVHEVHGDYYTSKVYSRFTGELLFNVHDVLDLGINFIVRHGQVLGLTETFRAKLDLALEMDSPLINFTTWNDFPEGHHLAPEINHNFGFAVVLDDYLRRWRGGPAIPSSDAVAVFFKKYQSNVTPSPYPVYLQIKQAVGPSSAEDGIEVVTMLSATGELSVNGGDPIVVPAGMYVTRVAATPGPVEAVVTRQGATVASVLTPEWITDQPYRTDRLTYSFSSEFERLYEAVFGPDAPRHSSMEYAEDASGQPNWQSGVSTLVDR